jgi:type II secretory pathway pseudopilin PulG
MGAISERGFTIVETMLFLAISGVLIVAILAGTGTSINIQRYHDSVVSLQTTIQNQYFDSTNVTNIPPTGALSCNTNATVTVNEGAPSSGRGQSDCVLLGRYITITNNGTTITTSSVVGYNNNDPSSYANDISDLAAYKMSLLPGSDEATTIEWGAQIAWPVSGSGAKSPTTPRTIAMLILRSPKSGLTYTFTSDDIPTTLTSIVVGGNQIPGQAQRRLCIDSGGPFTGGLAVVIDGYAATSSAIEMRSNDMGDASTC